MMSWKDRNICLLSIVIEQFFILNNILIDYSINVYDSDIFI